jgi:hypothetical protein
MMPDIFFKFPSRCNLKFMSGIFQIYTTHILSKSFGNMPGIYLDYSSACESACSSRNASAIGMQLLSQYTYFGCQGCLIFSAKRGGHACQRQSVRRCSPMWRSIDCDVAAAANPRNHDHDDVLIKLAQCTARKKSKFISKLEHLGYICKIMRSKSIRFKFST